jgi:voltage-gated potassium channel
MFDHFSHFIIYVRLYAQYLLRFRVTLMFLLLLVMLGGVVVSKVEGIKLGDGIYFACVTGLTVGYGDITPQTTMGRIVSVIIALLGVLFVGLTVAIATRALAETVKECHAAEREKIP